MNRIRVLSLAAALAAAAGPAAPAGATVFRTTTAADLLSGECASVCSLRDAIVAANASPGADVVLLRAGSYLLTLPGSGEDAGAAGDLDVADALTLVGAGASTTLVDAAGIDRVLHLLGDATLTVEDVTLRGGNETAGEGGGGVLAEAGSELALRRVQVEGNVTSGDGGGILSRAARLTVESSTVAGNEAGGDGGGLALANDAAAEDQVVNVTFADNLARRRGGAVHAIDNAGATLLHVTIAGNRAEIEGGGVHNESVPFLTVRRLALRNSILAGNTAPKAPDCGGQPDSRGRNLVAIRGECLAFTTGQGDLFGSASAPVEPRLGPLAGNGGPTDTRALLEGSPARNRGEQCPALDQRGAPRADALPWCDLGAFEVTEVCVAGGANLCLLDGRFRVTVRWRTPGGDTGAGVATPLGDASGTFTFFGPDAVEVVARMVDACAARDAYWVFLAGVTNLAVTVRVEDTVTDTVREYRNPLGRRFQTRLDTRGFATCGS
jgi:hypothetical protein